MLFKTTLLPFALLALSLTPLHAGPQEDATYIVEQTVNRSIYEAAIKSQRSIMIAAISKELQDEGISISNESVFFDILVEEMIDSLTEEMQHEIVPLYRTLFSDQQLSDLAAFYQTETGQALIAITPQIIAESAQLGHKVGMRMGKNITPRVVERIEKEGITINGDKSLTQRILDALK